MVWVVLGVEQWLVILSGLGAAEVIGWLDLFWL
jgi:hypothetical protein